MLGYLRVCKPELRIKEYELYKAVYCSLCKELGKSYGVLARFTLSYDFTFLALMSMSLNTNCCKLQKKACTCNPLKKCTYLEDLSELKMPAAAAMILVYYKLCDNIQDEKGIKRFAYRLYKIFLKRAYKKAATDFPHLNRIVLDYVKSQKQLENDCCSDLDVAAEPTARCMAEIFKTLSQDDIQVRCLERIGYSIGRYIYILDAADDLTDDVKLNRYNPLKGISNYNDLNTDYISPQLNICIAEAAKAYELLDIKKFKNILDNLIYIGLQDTFTKELNL